MSTQETTTFLNRPNVVSAVSAAACTLAAAIVFVPPSMAQRHERKAAQMEESAEARPASGGVTFEIALPLVQCLDTVLNTLKRNGHEVESASKDACERSS